MRGVIRADQRGIDDRVANAPKLLTLRARLGELFIDCSFKPGITDRLCPTAAVEKHINAGRKSFDLRPLA
jgi:hypothetical protein